MFWWRKLTERDHMQYTGIDGRIILKWFFGKWEGGHGLDSRRTEKRQVVGSCECGNENSER